MDRADAYRILGLREGATRTELKNAYEDRIRKYRTPDYQDEPEYAQRKIREVKYAYGILAGSAPPSSEKQRLEHHERRKDDIEAAETTDNALDNIAEKIKAAAARVRADAEDFIPHDEGSHSHNPKKRNAVKLSKVMKEKGFSAKGFKPSSIDPRTLKKLIIAFVVLISVFPTIMGACVSILIPEDYSYTGTSENTPAVYISDDIAETVDMLFERSDEYDFEGWLGARADSYDAVYATVTKTEGEENSFAQELALNLGIGDAESAIAYLYGDASLYEDNDDYENTCLLAENLMNAPTFEEVVGRQNLYRAERIWDYGSYMQFLIDVANSQTFSVLYG